MVRVVLEVDTEDVIGVKEAVAMAVERWGDVRVKEVTEVLPKQLEI